MEMLKGFLEYGVNKALTVGKLNGVKVAKKMCSYCKRLTIFSAVLKGSGAI